MLRKSIYYSLVLAACLAFSCRTSRSGARPDQAAPLSARLAKIKMTDLNGRPFSLQQLAGKPVFLNFWATWCRPCLSEMASIETVYQQFKKDIVFLAVSDEDSGKIRSFADKQNFSFEFARLEVPFIDVYVVSLPTTLLIGSDGQLIAEEEGLRIWTQFNNLEKLKALAKK